MAIVQISRIQHRRGRKNQGSGIPQLASGEIGWAIDTQEVYIGNGAVSEGAPAVGNTKLLTEADNLLSLAGQYAYKRDEIQTGVALASPVERTLQAKLDDRVSVRDFGAMGDGTDQTEKLQRAIDQLFINSATKGLYSSRLTLYIPAGEYLISSPGLKIPPYANIVGDGIDKTFLNSSGANPPENIFRTVNELSIPGTYADPSTTTSANMARFVRIEGMTIFHNSNGGALYLENCQNSMFTDMKISAGWGTGDGVTSEGVPGSNLVGIVVSNGSVATATSDYNIFKNIFINGFACAVYSEYDINNNKFLGGNVNTCGLGFVLGADPTSVPPVGKTNGAQYTMIEDYVFDLVDKQGLYVRTGNFNISQNNTYLNVGRDGGSSVVVEPVIEFYRTADSNGIGDAGHIDMDNNKSINDYFQRTAELTVDPLYFSQDYFPEVHGSKRIELSQPVRTSVGVKLIAETAIRLPSDQQRGVIALEYTYRAEDSDGPILQSGVLTVTYNRNNAEITLSDEHTFTGNPSKVGKLVFSVKGSAFQNGGSEIHLDIVNEMLDNLSPETDELEFTIKYIN
mgnify:FL=1